MQKTAAPMTFLQRLIHEGLYDSESDVIANSEVLIADLRDWLKGNGYDMAAGCLDLAVEKKAGKLRGDKRTPSILHEVSQALYTISLIEDDAYLADPEAVLSLNFIHDLGEDFGLQGGELLKRLHDDGVKGGTRLTQLARDFELMTKKRDGIPKYENEWQYYEALQESENASVAKMIDRIHNLATQIGVKKEKRCSEYILNTFVILNDFVVAASKNSPEQAPVYKSLKKMTETVSQIGRYYLARNEVGKPLPNMVALEDEMPALGFKVPSGINPIMLTASRVLEFSKAAPEEKMEQGIGIRRWLERRLPAFNML
jgi:hypothetical protein